MKYIIEISERVVSHVKIDYMDISDNDCAMMCDAVRTAIPYEERPHGKIVKDEKGYPMCSRCGEKTSFWNFCPRCGADMREGEKE